MNTTTPETTKTLAGLNTDKITARAKTIQAALGTGADRVSIRLHAGLDEDPEHNVDLELCVVAASLAVRLDAIDFGYELEDRDLDADADELWLHAALDALANNTRNNVNADEMAEFLNNAYTTMGELSPGLAAAITAGLTNEEGYADTPTLARYTDSVTALHLICQLATHGAAYWNEPEKLAAAAAALTVDELLDHLAVSLEATGQTNCDVVDLATMWLCAP